MNLDAVIFDMDGLLINSEPLWDEATIDVFDELGIRYAPSYFQETMGMRVDRIIAGWYAREPWPDLSPDEVSALLYADEARYLGQTLRGRSLNEVTGRS